MEQYITGIRVANDVMMLKMYHKGAVVIVEGSSDARFYHKHFDKTCRSIPAFSKPNVIRAIDELGRRNVYGILGIVDCDYMFLESQLPNHPNIIYTDFHDLETLLVLSPSLENVLRELVPGEKLHLLDHIGEKVRETLFELGMEIGLLRWASFRENLGLNFKNLPYSQITDAKHKIVDTKSLIKITSAAIKNPIANNVIEAKIAALKQQNADFKHICQGHDLVYLLELVIPVVFDDAFGNADANSVRSRCRSFILDDNLRLGYEKTYFMTTKLYLAMKDWEQKNTPYKILN
jgi:hypothetical protein